MTKYAFALLPILAALSRVHAMVGWDGDCPTIPSSTDCVSIDNDYKALKAVIEDSKTPDKMRIVKLCSFHVTRESAYQAPIIIHNQKIHVACEHHGACHIDGPGRHLEIKGSSTETIVQGFVFTNATKSAVKIYDAPRDQMICSCVFNDNRQSYNSKGAGLTTYYNTVTTIKHSNFTNNRNTRGHGGAIYNRGKMEVVGSKFSDNEAKYGSAISSSSQGYLDVISSTFADNKANDRGLIDVRGSSPDKYEDSGNNIAIANTGVCHNGVYNSNLGRCVEFMASDTTGERRSDDNDAVSVETGRALVSDNMPSGYFNYDSSDGKYGPKSWDRVDTRGNFWDYASAFRRMGNTCGRSGQSPISLGNPNARCPDTTYHQIRMQDGNYAASSSAFKYVIAPSRLKIEIHGGEDPSADAPDGWVTLPAVLIEVTCPSAHTLNGKRFDCEYTIFHAQANKKRILAVSVLIDAGSSYNSQFQMMLDQWKRVDSCSSLTDRRRRLSLSANTTATEADDAFDEQLYMFDQYERTPYDDMFAKNYSAVNQEYDEDEYENYYDERDGDNVNKNDDKDSGLSRNSNIDRKLASKLQIYHRSLVPSAYFYAYKGSLLEPPCLNIVQWRVMDKPMKISKSQKSQIIKLLTNGPCQGKKIAEGLGSNFARPMQGGLSNYHCDRKEWPLDCERRGKKCNCRTQLCPADFK